MTKTPAYPTSFFVAHKLFDFDGLKTWGDILDGPIDDDDALIEAVLESFRDELPGFDTLRVWWITPDMPAADYSRWAIDTAIDEMVAPNE